MKIYRLSPRVQRDIAAIWDYSGAIWGSDRAESYIRQIQHTCEILAGDMRLGRACDDIRPFYRKFRSGSHILFYREADGDIEIIRILHQSMDFEEHLLPLNRDPIRAAPQLIFSETAIGEFASCPRNALISFQ
jgi:toxin ParE1/3/4